MGMSFGTAFPSKAEFKEHWVSFTVWGLVLIALGCIAIYLAQIATILTVVMLGALLTAAGVIVTFDSFKTWWGRSEGFFLHFISGILYLILGILLLVSPLVGAITLTLVMSVFFIIIGIFRIILSPLLRFPRWGWSFVSGIITLILGILILAQMPTSGLFIIGLFVGIDLLLWGWTYLTLAIFAKAS